MSAIAAVATDAAPCHQAACVSLRFSPSGRLLASASADKSVLIVSGASYSLALISSSL